jgi:imidazolonepropionase-like amidohydrolase
MILKSRLFVALAALPMFCAPLGAGSARSRATPANAIVLRAARLLDIDGGRIVRPGEVLVQGERIAEVGSAVKHPAGAEIIDLGDSTLLPGLIDAHVHLFLHPGAEDLQTVQESVSQRTILAVLAARAGLKALARRILPSATRSTRD